MFADQSAKSGKDSFLAENTRKREEREQQKNRNENATIIQTTVRGFLVRRRFRSNQIILLKSFIEENPNWAFIDNTSVHMALRGILFKYDSVYDELLEIVCRLLSANIFNQHGTTKTWYNALALNPKLAAEHIIQVRRLITAICLALKRCTTVRYRYKTKSQD